MLADFRQGDRLLNRVGTRGLLSQCRHLARLTEPSVTASKSAITVSIVFQMHSHFPRPLTSLSLQRWDATHSAGAQCPPAVWLTGLIYLAFSSKQSSQRGVTLFRYELSFHNCTLQACPQEEALPEATAASGGRVGAIPMLSSIQKGYCSGSLTRSVSELEKNRRTAALESSFRANGMPCTTYRFPSRSGS